MRSGSGGGENVTTCEPSALVVAIVSGTGYNMGIGGREPPPPPPAMTATKLTPAQQRTFSQILDAKPSTPDKVIHGAWLQVSDWTSVKTGHTWKAGRVYGRFNTSTLKALEKKGLIRVHFYGPTGGSCDEIEVMAPDRLVAMLECRTA